MVRAKFIKELKGEAINILDEIWDFICYNDLVCFIKHVFRFVRRLKTWLPLCWRTENWDFEGHYDFIEMFMKDQLKAHEEDTWHIKKDVDRRIKQIKICLAYLDRYRNWPKYYDYPMDDIQHVPSKTYENCYEMIHTSSINEAKRKGVHAYEKFMYDMFWKRFLQWHQGWWT